MHSQGKFFGFFWNVHTVAFFHWALLMFSLNGESSDGILLKHITWTIPVSPNLFHSAVLRISDRKSVLIILFLTYLLFICPASSFFILPAFLLPSGEYSNCYNLTATVLDLMLILSSHSIIKEMKIECISHERCSWKCVSACVSWQLGITCSV